MTQSGLFFFFFFFYSPIHQNDQWPSARCGHRPGGPCPRATRLLGEAGEKHLVLAGVFVPLFFLSASSYGCDFLSGLGSRATAMDAEQSRRGATGRPRPRPRRGSEARRGARGAGVSDSLLILQSKQANVMCLTLAVSLKVSAAPLISRAAFWGHSDAGVSAARGEQDMVANKDSIYKGC